LDKRIGLPVNLFDDLTSLLNKLANILWEFAEFVPPYETPKLDFGIYDDEEGIQALATIIAHR